MIFEDCAVPVENVFGEVGRGHTIAFNVLNLGRFYPQGQVERKRRIAARLAEAEHYVC